MSWLAVLLKAKLSLYNRKEWNQTGGTVIVLVRLDGNHKRGVIDKVVSIVHVFYLPLLSWTILSCHKIKVRPLSTHVLNKTSHGCFFGNSKPFCAQVFFFKAWYQQGNVVPNKQSTSDFLWVTKDELSEYCPKSYLKSIKRFLANLWRQIVWMFNLAILMFKNKLKYFYIYGFFIVS